MIKCLWHITKLPDDKMTMLFTHYFTCEKCKTHFSIMTTDEHYSDALGTIDCMATCPNSMCGSVHVVMDDVIEEML